MSDEPRTVPDFLESQYKVDGETIKFDLARTANPVSMVGLLQGNTFKLIDENAQWLKKSQEDTLIYLNLNAYKADIESHEAFASKFISSIYFQTFGGSSGRTSFLFLIAFRINVDEI